MGREYVVIKQGFKQQNSIDFVCLHFAKASVRLDCQGGEPGVQGWAEEIGLNWEKLKRLQPGSGSPRALKCELV